MKKNIFDLVEDLLKTKTKYVSEDGKLVKTLISSDIMTMNESLLSLLLSNEEIKKTFFKNINGTLIFDKQKFAWFIESKEFLPDSYTKYTNKIGLTHNGDFISSTNDVVLDFPFKDCVLEGGQTKDDQKRNEIFYNEIIAKDEISRMLAPKVFTNAKRYTKDGVEENIEFNENDNLIIKGNNLIALSSLLERYEGKVKLIYIDPPYNTGNDSFNYNDSFNHSTWLTFMKNRLELARKLLKEDGVIFVQCDDNEQAYLKVLMDDIFGVNKFIANFMWMKTSTPPSLSKNVRKKLEYILCYTKNSISGLKGGIVEGGDMPLLNEANKMVTLHFPINTVSFKIKDNLYQKGQKDKVYLEQDLLVKDNYNKNELIITGNFKWSQETLLEEIKNKTQFIVKSDKFAIRYMRLGERIKVPSNLISKVECLVGTNEDAKKELEALFNKKTIFNFPKPESLIHYLVNMNTNKNDLVLDFNLGSGTTTAVAHKMGRKYIGIEQMDYIQNITIERMKKVIDGEQGGISKSIDWKGGGSFVYFELLENANELIEKVYSSTYIPERERERESWDNIYH
ncbi:TYPE III RESTRICTION-MODIFICATION SYSTEM: METHYLASE [Mycoplasmopsis pulmonis]|uniref:TYPE III RESTRICTION-MODIFICATION SYSTEM: METHYLASE n=1 Tax=Mycoplasmopsis pulmonis (strain UAB CTIP) TaxID=272635 RepID=Q98QG7_MYCPU|nr:site-specific DNA-methyltransferase [Mycoplasmopsis pulmonis]CAC13570.1 TYPE III RESTRICTION-MODIFICATION SYSTEM: METHYLASE [Mycoplasmopsis pulmonis]